MKSEYKPGSEVTSRPPVTSGPTPGRPGEGTSRGVTIRTRVGVYRVGTETDSVRSGGDGRIVTDTPHTHGETWSQRDRYISYVFLSLSSRMRPEHVPKISQIL